MKVEIRENEIELIPESEHDRDAIVKIFRQGIVSVKDGLTTDRNYPPSSRKTNLVLCLRDPNKW